MDFEFKIAGSEHLLPDDEKMAGIFSRLGYHLADAIADLVDNSVDAHASKVHIRFVRSTGGIQSILIVDNGCGMDASVLLEAMRFGSRSNRSSNQLGKYGIGLKAASFSQAQTLVVLSKQGSSTLGRRWTIENVKRNWTCEFLVDADVQKVFRPQYGEFHTGRSGTIIIWERLEHLNDLHNNLDQVLEDTIHELDVELGIRFHRFLEDGRLTISVDQQYGMEKPTGLPTYIVPLNPFSYERSGHSAYPLTLKLNLNNTVVDAVCHIWPPKCKSPGYRLGGGKVALRQGFYFYRNDRVIQAGGWNGIHADDGEPHYSLARVSVDLPAALDSMFKLAVTKSKLIPSSAFRRALQSTATKGVTFENYLEQALAAYRKQKTKDRARFPFIPGKGFTARAQKSIASILAEDGADKPKRVSFVWKDLDPGEMFRPNLRRNAIYLNTLYRKYLVEGRSHDAPVLKLLLMFLCQGELEKAFLTGKSLEWLQRVNDAALASLKKN